MSLQEDIQWFDTSFGPKIKPIIATKKYTKNFVISLACKEMRYLWSPLRKKGLPPEKVLELMVGDTIDAKADGKGRSAFPKNRKELEDYQPKGKEMFVIARKSLLEMAAATGQYATSVANPDKFVRGYGIFQYDLQYFHSINGGHTAFFLEKKWVDFGACLTKMTIELDKGLTRLAAKFPQLKINDSAKLSFDNSVWLAIAYNKGAGGIDLAKGFKQGHLSDGVYYGEEFRDILAVANQVAP